MYCNDISKMRDAPIAQSVEQMTLNHWVQGSSPCGRTITLVSIQRILRRSESAFFISALFLISGEFRFGCRGEEMFPGKRRGTRSGKKE